MGIEEKKTRKTRTSREKLLRLIFCLFLSLSCLGGESNRAGKNRVILGNETLLENFPPSLREKRLGLVINQTSVLPDGKFLIDALLEKGHRVESIFSPEHGFRGVVEGGEEVREERFKNIKIHSLYGQNRKPTPDQTREIDAFVYDIQDVGARFYTYITTLKYVMEAAAESKIPVYVLDRPNPVGGKVIEGPLLRPEYETFIGALPIPVRYGLTIGELALMMRGEGWVPKDVSLHVVKMKNWKRAAFWKETGLAWIPPSPNMPAPETAIVYPGLGFLEAVNLNEGRGTPYPFLQCGAPWLDAHSIINDLGGGRPFGAELIPVTFTPRSLPGKALHPRYQDQLCQGIRVNVVKSESFLALRFAISLMKAVRDRHPGQFSPEYRRLSIMFGDDSLTSFLKGETSYEKLVVHLEKEEKAFREKSRKYLLYE